MYNAEMYLLEKQAQRRTRPLSQVEMVRLYSQTKKQASTLTERLGAALSAVTKGNKTRSRQASAQPALETQ